MGIWDELPRETRAAIVNLTGEVPSLMKAAQKLFVGEPEAPRVPTRASKLPPDGVYVTITIEGCITKTLGDDPTVTVIDRTGLEYWIRDGRISIKEIGTIWRDEPL